MHAKHPLYHLSYIPSRGSRPPPPRRIVNPKAGEEALAAPQIFVQSDFININYDICFIFNILG